jgi:hypothetical protein
MALDLTGVGTLNVWNLAAASEITSTSGMSTTGRISATGNITTTGSLIANSLVLTGSAGPLAVSQGGTGLSSPGTSGFALRSNGTGFVASKLGLGMTGEVWSSPSRAFNTNYTNSLSYPIAVSARTNCSGGSAINFIVDGVSISNFNWQFNGCGSFGGGFMIVPPGSVYQLSSGQSLNFWRELS